MQTSDACSPRLRFARMTPGRWGWASPAVPEPSGYLVDTNVRSSRSNVGRDLAADEWLRRTARPGAIENPPCESLQLVAHQCHKVRPKPALAHRFHAWSTSMKRALTIGFVALGLAGP